MTNRYLFLGFLVAAAVMLAIGVQTAQSNSATYDEPALLAAGYSYLTTHDFRMEGLEPPLGKMVPALPLLLIRPQMRLDSSEWLSADMWAFGRAMLFRWNSGEQLLFWGRMTTLALALILAVFVLCWSFQFYQSLFAGLTSLAFLVLTPDLMAHSTIVQSDVILTACLFVATYGFVQFLRRANVGNALMTGIALVFSILAKHPAWIALAWLVPIGIWRIIDHEPWTWEWRIRKIELKTPKAKTLALVIAAFAWLGAAILSIWLIYGFTYDSRKVATSDRFVFVVEPTDNPAKSAARYLIQLYEPLPRTYLWGIGKMAESHVYPAFFGGQTYPDGSYLYFPFTFITKTPIPFLILLFLVVLVGLWSMVRHFDMLTLEKLALTLPIPIWLGVAVLSRSNIGQRHILEIYPFLAVWVGYWGSNWMRRTYFARALIIIALVWQGISVFSVHPFYLSYMNELLGGPSKGYMNLVDSSMDWGQGLKAMAAYWRNHDQPPLKLSYFGQADPAYYGIRFVPLESAAPDELAGQMVAISATAYQLSSMADPKRDVAFLHSVAPTDLVAYSILIFDFRNCSKEQLTNLQTQCIKR